MIFKWTSKNKTAPEAPAETPTETKAAETEATPPVAPSSGAGQMARDLFEKVVPFKSRSAATEGEAAAAFIHEGGLGQEQAIETLRFGAAMRGHDYNMMAAVPAGVDGTALIKAVLKTALKTEGLTDWVYVRALLGTETWKPLALPAGRAAQFKALLDRALLDLEEALPDVFASESYQLRRLAIDEMHGREAEGAVTALIHKAAAKNVAVLRLPQGFSVAPMHEGKVVRPEVLSQLPETMRREVEARVRGFQSELEGLLQRMPHLDRAKRSELRELHEDIVAKAATLALSDAREAFSSHPQVLARLDAIAADMKAQAPRIVASMSEGTSADIWQRYDVVLMQSAEAGRAPLVELHDVRSEGLCGRCSSRPQPGSLHAANGGAIVLSADALLHDPDVREILVRTVMSREIAPIGAGAEPLPFDAKVVLLGEPETCDRLLNVDRRLRGLFKLKIELRETMARTKESEALFAEAVQGIVTRHKTKPIEPSVTALLVDEASRAAGDDQRLSLALIDTGDLVREASAWADIAGDGTIDKHHVTRALKARDERRGVSPAHTQQNPGKVAKALGS